NSFQILDGPIDKAPRTVIAGDRRHKGIGSGSQYHLVIGQTQALLRGDCLLLTIDGDDAVAEVDGDAIAGKEIVLHQRQVAGGLAGEKFGQVYAIVGRSRLLAEGDDVEDGRQVLLGNTLQEPLPHHSVSDDDQIWFLHDTLTHNRFVVTSSINVPTCKQRRNSGLLGGACRWCEIAALLWSDKMVHAPEGTVMHGR